MSHRVIVILVAYVVASLIITFGTGYALMRKRQREEQMQAQP